MLRIALAIGFCIDAFVGLLCLFAQPLLLPLLDLPVKDPAAVTIAGGELIVAAGIYAFVFTNPQRWRPLLWLCALDQCFAVVLPALEIVRGNVPGTLKTIGPLPFQFALAVFYALNARVPQRTDEPHSGAGTGTKR